jgi:cell division control protein 6
MLNVKTSENINETGSLFDNYYVFRDDYIPKTYHFRSGQLSKMGMHSRGLDFDEEPSIMKLVGSCATGKTSVMKEYFRQAQKAHPKLFCVYIDCDSENTKYKIYSEIYLKLKRKRTKSIGLKFSDLKKEVMDYLIDNDTILLIGLDDYELINNKELNDILYSLIRARTTYSVRLSLVMASSEKKNIKLRNNVKTVFKPVEVYFPQYSQIEMFHILEQRAKEAFYDGVIDDVVINYIADQTFNTGDLRKGIDLLRRSGLNAEDDNSTQILIKHVY